MKFVNEHNHRVFMCPKLANNSKEALQLIQEKQLCTNCLYKHDVNECMSRGSCKTCKQRHHTLLHEALFNSSQTCHIVQTEQFLHSQLNERALLATAWIPVTSYDGSKILLRALIDQGSTSNCISERGAQLIRCNRKKVFPVFMLGLGNVQTGTSRFTATFTIGSMYEMKFELSIWAYISPFITTVRPITRGALREWKHLTNLQLADPSNTNCQDIDLLIGSITYGHIIEEGLSKGKINEPIA